MLLVFRAGELIFALSTTSNCLQYIIQINELSRYQSQRDSLDLVIIAPKKSESN
jgi:hypothetical protein